MDAACGHWYVRAAAGGVWRGVRRWGLCVTDRLLQPAASKVQVEEVTGTNTDWLLRSTVRSDLAN